VSQPCSYGEAGVSEVGPLLTFSNIGAVGPPPPSPLPKSNKHSFVVARFLFLCAPLTISEKSHCALYVSTGVIWEKTWVPSRPIQLKVE